MLSEPINKELSRGVWKKEEKKTPYTELSNNNAVEDVTVRKRPP